MPFFKRDREDLLEAPNVESTGYSLSEQNKDEVEFPIDGWYWFPDADSAIEAGL